MRNIVSDRHGCGCWLAGRRRLALLFCATLYSISSLLSGGLKRHPLPSPSSSSSPFAGAPSHDRPITHTDCALELAPIMIICASACADPACTRSRCTRARARGYFMRASAFICGTAPAHTRARSSARYSRDKHTHARGHASARARSYLGSIISNRAYTRSPRRRRSVAAALNYAYI